MSKMTFIDKKYPNIDKVETLKKALSLIDEFHCEREAIRRVLGCSNNYAELFIESCGIANYTDYTAYVTPFDTDEQRKAAIKKAIKRLWTSTHHS